MGHRTRSCVNFIIGHSQDKILAKNITEKVKHEKSTSNYFQSSVKYLRNNKI